MVWAITGSTEILKGNAAWQWESKILDVDLEERLVLHLIMFGHVAEDLSGKHLWQKSWKREKENKEYEANHLKESDALQVK